MEAFLRWYLTNLHKLDRYRFSMDHASYGVLIVNKEMVDEGLLQMASNIAAEYLAPIEGDKTKAAGHLPDDEHLANMKGMVQKYNGDKPTELRIVFRNSRRLSKRAEQAKLKGEQPEIYFAQQLDEMARALLLPKDGSAAAASYFHRLFNSIREAVDRYAQEIFDDYIYRILIDNEIDSPNYHRLFLKNLSHHGRQGRVMVLKENAAFGNVKAVSWNRKLVLSTVDLVIESLYSTGEVPPIPLYQLVRDLMHKHGPLLKILKTLFRKKIESSSTTGNLNAPTSYVWRLVGLRFLLPQYYGGVEKSTGKGGYNAQLMQSLLRDSANLLQRLISLMDIEMSGVEGVHKHLSFYTNTHRALTSSVRSKASLTRRPAPELIKSSPSSFITPYRDLFRREDTRFSTRTHPMEGLNRLSPNTSREIHSASSKTTPRRSLSSSFAAAAAAAAAEEESSRRNRRPPLWFTPSDYH